MGNVVEKKTMDESIAIKVENLSKQYILNAQRSESFRETLTQFFRQKKADKKSVFQAISNISFEIQKGEVVGVIGRNGAGKSTLLKLLSRITKPSEGTITINGRVASLLEVGTGFHPELTGRENIYLNGTILGMSKKEVTQKLDEIIAFSGVQRFIDTPVKHYSSGMYVRLAFSVAAHLEPEILIVDEVLAVGDADFQKKCIGKMKDVAGSGRTVLFVSHNIAAIKSLCTKGMVLKNGGLIFEGNVNDCVDFYLQKETRITNYIELSTAQRERGLLRNKIHSITFDALKYTSNSPFAATIHFQKNQIEKATKFNCSLHIVDQYDNQVYHLNNEFIGESNLPFQQIESVQFKIPELRLKSGIYGVWLWLQCDGEEEDLITEGISFEVVEGNSYNYDKSHIISGVVQPIFSILLNKNNQ